MAKQPTFEQSLKSLEDAVARLEKGQIPLDEALACFEDGVKGAGRCRELLREVETQVEVLLKDSAGSFRVEPFDTDDDDNDDDE
ncbi:MAG: exodeoxyribonuclease VII small subunit [Desulfuromonadales bacterium]|nr:exodeoxyribonuclease VII small subunit [Desulfuromonadales bacterium]